MLILGQKGANLDQKGPKMGGAKLFWTANLNFPKEEYKISFYTINQQDSTIRLEDISQNVDFGPKRGQIWNKKGPKWAEADFFPELSLGYFINRHKM